MHEKTLRTSDRAWWIALVLAVVAGPIGAHRFYLGRYLSGILRLALIAGAVGVAPHMSAPAAEAPVTRFFMAFGAAAFLELVFTIGTGAFLFRKLGLGRLPYPNVRRLDPFLAAALVTGYLLFCLIAALNYENVPAILYLLFLACAAFSGILWCKDLVRMGYWNDLADAENAVLR